MLRNYRNYFVQNRYSIAVFVLLNIACMVCIGLVLARVGRIPDGGVAVDVARWRLEVLEVDHNAISRVRLVPLPHPSEDGLA